MKKEYETPSVDVFVFETPEEVMGGDGCPGYTCPSHCSDVQLCVLDDDGDGCFLDGYCIYDGNSNCILDGVCATEGPCPVDRICFEEYGFSVPY